MKLTRTIIFLGVCWAIYAYVSPTAVAQIRINELVKEERSISGGLVTPNAREFVELYNAGVSPVDLTGWTLTTFDLTAGSPVLAYTIPGSPEINPVIAPGDYFVIGKAVVPGVDYSPPIAGDLWPDIVASALELRDASSAYIDAVAYDVARTGTIGLSFASAELVAQIGSGYQASPISPNAVAPNARLSWSRYEDGLDTNRNGLDFGFLPLTPGATNETLPKNPSHTIPNVDSLNVGTELSGQYYTSFVMPRVVDPTVATAINPRALPTRSPQGGNAIIAWDESGGGNAVYSRELVNKFDLYAYFDTTPLGVAAGSLDEEYEQSVYGLGTVDPLMDNVDPTGLIPDDEIVPPTRSGETGIGWLYQQFEPDPDGIPGTAFSKLFLVDFGDSGDSVPAPNPQDSEWKIIQELDLSDDPSGWYRLGLDYNPTTGGVVATFGDQTFNFSTDTNRNGQFYVGYREGISGAPTASGRFPLHNPPVYDMIAAAGLVGDYNDNDVVDAADYVVWRNAQPTDVLPNDPTPGMVDASDYITWKANFGKTAGSGSGGVALVPEPAGVALAAIGLLFAMATRRRS